MKKIVYLNGNFVDEADAKVSVFDRGFLFADGVYEVVPVINGVLIDKEPFIARLQRSLGELSLKPKMDIDEILTMIETLISKNSLVEGGVYMQVTRGVAPREFYFPIDAEPTCMAFTFAKEIIHSLDAVNGVTVASVDDIRWKRRDIKSIALLGQCMAKEQAHQKGAYEGWMIEDGFVTEGVASSAYIVKNGTIITKPLSHEILPGIRRKLILELAPKHGFKIEQRSFTIDEAYDADEAFLSSATTMVYPIIEIDGKPIGDGKAGDITKAIREMYIEEALKLAGIPI